MDECEDNLATQALRRAANNKNPNNAERDLHVLFRNCNLTLPIKTKVLKLGLLQVSCLRLTSWAQYLLDHFSHLLLGGFNKDDPLSCVLLKTFWKNYKANNSDHLVYGKPEVALMVQVGFGFYNCFSFPYLGQ